MFFPSSFTVTSQKRGLCRFLHNHLLPPFRFVQSLQMRRTKSFKWDEGFYPHLRQNAPDPKLLNGNQKYHCPLTTRLSSHRMQTATRFKVWSFRDSKQTDMGKGRGERLGRGGSGSVCVCVEEGLLSSVDTFCTPLDIENVHYWQWAFSMSKGVT
jgi:hypothetical protein